MQEPSFPASNSGDKFFVNASVGNSSIVALAAMAEEFFPGQGNEVLLAVEKQVKGESLKDAAAIVQRSIQLMKQEYDSRKERDRKAEEGEKDYHARINSWADRHEEGRNGVAEPSSARGA